VELFRDVGFERVDAINRGLKACELEERAAKELFGRSDERLGKSHIDAKRRAVHFSVELRLRSVA